jgi:hypothetical protein
MGSCFTGGGVGSPLATPMTALMGSDWPISNREGTSPGLCVNVMAVVTKEDAAHSVVADDG